MPSRSMIRTQDGGMSSCCVIGHTAGIEKGKKQVSSCQPNLLHDETGRLSKCKGGPMRLLFTQVKSQVTTRQAAERYGIQVNRSGMACCPFHDDHHPSMKIDERFYCFGCHTTGDVIDFTAKLFDLSLYQNNPGEHGSLFGSVHAGSLRPCHGDDAPGQREQDAGLH